MPDSLFNIINNPEKRKKLVMYINPPYAEAGTGLGKGHKKDITLNFRINEKFKPLIGNSVNEIFALFMAIIYEKIQGCILGQFSTLKFVNGNNYKKFKDYFLAEYVNGFIVPSVTFDNVKGKFPIGFTIWNTLLKLKIENVLTGVYDNKGSYIGIKKFYGNLPKGINQWINKYQDKNNLRIGFLDCSTPDFQNKNYVFIDTLKNETNDHRFHLYFTQNNIKIGAIYFSVRHCIKATWLNDRDQFLYPNDGWEKDKEFQNDCLAYTLFHSQNKISSKEGINHWIPFTEQEVNAQNRFESSFMSDFIKGKIKPEEESATIFTVISEPKVHYEVPIKFSDEAKYLFDAGRELWKYYHSQPNVNVNASLYDIREYFQGRNEQGRMNSKSEDFKYMELIGGLRNALNILADKIKPKVYEYEFLKE